MKSIHKTSHGIKRQKVHETPDLVEDSTPKVSKVWSNSTNLLNFQGTNHLVAASNAQVALAQQVLGCAAAA